MLEGKFEYLGEKREKYKTLPIPIKKEKEITKIDKDGNGSIETISFKIKFIDSMRFYFYGNFMIKPGR